MHCWCGRTFYRRVRQRAESTQHLVSFRVVAARQLPDNEGMGPNLRLFQQRNERGVTSTQMVNPDGRIDQHLRWLAGGSRPAAGDRLEMLLSSTQRG